MTVTINTPALNAIADGARQRIAQEEYAMRVAFLMRQYVPRDENTLRASEPLNSQYSHGELIWNTPYAAVQYYKPMSHTTSNTQDHWDEPVKRQHMPELEEYVAKMYEES